MKNYKICALLLFLLTVTDGRSSDLGNKEVDFYFDGQTVKLFTYKSRHKLSSKKTESVNGVFTSIHDRFDLGSSQFFVGSELVTGSDSYYRNGLFKLIGGENVYLIGPGDGFSFEYEGEVFVLLHNGFSNKARYMESRLFRLKESRRDDLLIDLLFTFNDLIIMDAINYDQKLLVSGYCDGAEFAFELSFDKNLDPKIKHELLTKQKPSADSIGCATAITSSNNK